MIKDKLNGIHEMLSIIFSIALQYIPYIIIFLIIDIPSWISFILIILMQILPLFAIIAHPVLYTWAFLCAIKCPTDILSILFFICLVIKIIIFISGIIANLNNKLKDVFTMKKSNNKQQIREMKYAQAKSDGLSMRWFSFTVNIRLIMTIFFLFIDSSILAFYNPNDIDWGYIFPCIIYLFICRSNMANFKRKGIFLYFLQFVIVASALLFVIVCAVLNLVSIQEISISPQEISSFLRRLFFIPFEAIYYRKRLYLFSKGDRTGLGMKVFTWVTGLLIAYILYEVFLYPLPLGTRIFTAALLYFATYACIQALCKLWHNLCKSRETNQSSANIVTVKIVDEEQKTVHITEMLPSKLPQNYRQYADKYGIVYLKRYKDGEKVKLKQLNHQQIQALHAEHLI